MLLALPDFFQHCHFRDIRVYPSLPSFLLRRTLTKASAGKATAIENGLIKPDPKCKQLQASENINIFSVSV